MRSLRRVHRRQAKVLVPRGRERTERAAMLGPTGRPSGAGRDPRRRGQGARPGGDQGLRRRVGRQVAESSRQGHRQARCPARLLRHARRALGAPEDDEPESTFARVRLRTKQSTPMAGTRRRRRWRSVESRGRQGRTLEASSRPGGSRQSGCLSLPNAGMRRRGASPTDPRSGSRTSGTRLGSPRQRPARSGTRFGIVARRAAADSACALKSITTERRRGSRSRCCR